MHVIITLRAPVSCRSKLFFGHHSNTWNQQVASEYHDMFDLTLVAAVQVFKGSAHGLHSQ